MEVWTIGHSTRSIEQFIGLLKAFDIGLLADVRHYPGSRKFPHFNKDVLEIALKQNDLDYVHLQSLEQLERFASKQRTAYMCSEAVWWSCHRSLISDVLKSKQWKVWHIMDAGKATEHPYTKPARIVDGVLRYDEAG